MVSENLSLACLQCDGPETCPTWLFSMSPVELNPGYLQLSLILWFVSEAFPEGPCVLLPTDEL